MTWYLDRSVIVPIDHLLFGTFLRSVLRLGRKCREPQFDIVCAPTDGTANLDWLCNRIGSNQPPNGLRFLAPMKGKLKELDLSMSLVSASDLKKLKGDHPDLKVTTLPAAEIVKRHRYIAQNLAKSAPPELAIELKAALAATESQP